MAKKKTTKRRRNPQFGATDTEDFKPLTAAQADKLKKQIEADRARGII